MRPVRRRFRAALASYAAIAVLLALPSSAAAQLPKKHRPIVGVAFGGGSALGLAHVGVIKWFEDHHVPIDVVAGTSMGGLIGGAYATGMSSADLTKMLAHVDWDRMFGSSYYRYRSVRRKEDMRQFPSRLEFEVRRGVTLPSALNDGQQVDVFLASIAAVYGGMPFDSLPTPFRCVAFDIRSAERVVLDSGSLAQAMRATMSLPGIFPPVEEGERLLVDGGTVDNVPADVARAMGADVVIAVNVGRLPKHMRDVQTSLFSLASGTVNAMMRSSTKRGLAEADVVVNPVLEKFGSSDWKDAPEMAKEGYRAADDKRESLLALAVSDAEWREYLASRARKRRTSVPMIDSIQVTGATPDDERTIRHRLRAVVGRPLDAARLDAALIRVAALDRYESASWDFVDHDGHESLLIRARPRPNAPPIGMFALNAYNLTTNDYTFQLAVRYLAFDALLPRAELRLDVAVGSDPGLGAELRRSLGYSPVFLAGLVGARSVRRDFASQNALVAQYDQGEVFAEGDIGLTFGVRSELRVGARGGYVDARRRLGDPGLPSLSGGETQVLGLWIYDSQTRYIAPESGLRLVGSGRYVFTSPEVPASFGTTASNVGLSQMELRGSHFWSTRQKRDRIFLVGGAATSFGNQPLPTAQYILGLPFRLDAFSVGERRGDEYWGITGGYLFGVGRLPDFLGGGAYAGAWLENGAVSGHATDASVATQLGVGMLVETLVGPALLGITFGGGERRVHVGCGGSFPGAPDERCEPWAESPIARPTVPHDILLGEPTGGRPQRSNGGWSMYEAPLNWSSNPGRIAKMGVLVGVMMLPTSTLVGQATTTSAKPAVEPKALDELRTMGAYLRSLKEFIVRADGVRDEIMKNGQKIQLGGTVAYNVRVPDHLKAEINTDRKQRTFYYDGKTLTVYAPRMHYYATVNAPSTIGAMLDSAESRYGLEFPIDDLFLWGTPKDQMKKITSATFVGPAFINGIEAEHYAYRQPGVDWQLWVQRGNTPLPLKIVITSRDNAAQPQYAATLKWDLTSKFNDATFAFVPPKDASKIMIASWNRNSR